MDSLDTKWYQKEDSWAILIGLGTILLFSGCYILGAGDLYNVVVVKFTSWTGGDIASAFQGKSAAISHIIALYLFFAVFFTIAGRFFRFNAGRFLAGFSFIYVLSLGVNVLAANKLMKDMQFEAVFIALLLGLLIGNTKVLPQWLHSALRTEFYVKTGVVLMGATLPLTLILSAGPVAIVQATIVAVTTFFAIYFAATKFFHLDPRFGATLGAGGSICGVSASIAIGSSCRAKQEHVSVAITLVILWAVVMIFALPLAARVLGMTPGTAGAWIGTSEFADAAGFAAVSGLGSEAAIQAFTLMKVIGRDIFVGIWAFVAAVLSVTIWDKSSLKESETISVGEIWHRFPKFVIGFALASAIVSSLIVMLQAQGLDAAYSKEVIGSIKNLRGWAFTWTFLSIGMTTRFKELSAVGWKPLAAFTVGVIVNVPLGYVLSNIIFADFWNAL